jgi:BTB/POZ domain
MGIFLAYHIPYKDEHISELEKKIIKISLECFNAVLESAKEGNFQVLVNKEFFGTREGANLMRQVLEKSYHLTVSIIPHDLKYREKSSIKTNSFGKVYKVELAFWLTLIWGPKNEFIYSKLGPYINPHQMNPEDYLNKFWDKAQCGIETDVIFQLGKWNFDAHSQILKMQSPVFQRKFIYQNPVELPECCTKVFRLFLGFIYKGNLTIVQSEKNSEFLHNVASLFYLAKKFEISQLKQWCEWEIDHYIKNIIVSEENVIELCKVAKYHGLDSVQAECLKYFNQAEKGPKQFTESLNTLVVQEPVQTLTIRECRRGKSDEE